MMTLRVLTDSAPCLRRKCDEVKRITLDEKKLLDAMLQTMYACKGVGLAASQVGVLKRLIVIDVGEGPLRLINPRIINKSGSCVMEEGCLSLPEIQIEVRRAKDVEVEAEDHQGRQHRFLSQGLLARVLQHEIDHLNGVLIIDYISWYERLLVRNKLGRQRVRAKSSLEEAAL